MKIVDICLIVASTFLYLSCDLSEATEDISTNESPLPEFKIVAEMGEMINPIFKDTSVFVGLPGYLGVDDKQEQVYLIIGKSMKKGQKVKLDSVTSFGYEIGDVSRKIHLGVPKNKNQQSIHFDEQLTFNIDYNNLKLWIQDWVQYAYVDKNVVFLGWN